MRMMKWIISILILFCGFWTEAQTLDSRKYNFGDGDGYAAVLKQISGVEVQGETNLYVGDSLSLNAVVACLSGVSYEINWFRREGTPVATGGKLFINPLTEADAGGYYCVATDLLTGTTTTSDTLEISVENSVVTFENITLAASKLNYCEGAADSLWVRSFTLNTDHCAKSVKAKIDRGEYTLTRQWWHNGVAVANTEKCYLRNVSVGDAGKYYCELHIEATDGLFSGTGKSDSCQVAVKQRPELVVTPGEQAKVIFGHSLELQVSGADSYLWNTGSREASITIAPLEPETYSVKGYSTGGCYTEKIIQVDVVRLKLNIGNDRVIFKGDSLAMDIETNADSVLWYEQSNLRLLAGVDAYSSVASGRLVGRGTKVVLTPVVTTTYQLQIYFNGSMTAVPFTVTVKDTYAGGFQDGYAQTCIPPRIVAQHGADEGVGCVLEDVELFVQPEGTEIQMNWEIFDRTTGEFTAFTGADNVTGLGQNRLTFQNFDKPNNGIYRCRITNVCGEVVSDTFMLNDKRAPMIVGPLNEDQALCQDDGRKAQLGIRVEPIKNITYQWYKAETLRDTFAPIDGGNTNYMELPLVPSSDGVYKVVASNVCGSDSSTINLSIITPPVIDAFSEEVNVCEGSDAQFYVQVSGKGSFKYSLKELDPQDNLNVINQWEGEATVTLPAVTRNRLFVWEVENAGKKCGTTRSENISLIVDHPLQFLENVPLGLDTLVCSGEKGFIQVVTLEPTNSKVTYSWSRNGIELPEQNLNYLYVHPLKQEDAGKYTLTARNKCPAIRSNELMLRVNETPEILSSPDVDRTYCEGHQLHLRTVVSDKYAVDSIRWYLNDYKLVDEIHHVRGADTLDIQVDSMTSGHSGVYVTRLYNVCGMSSTEPVTIDLLQKAVFDYKLENYDTLLCMPEKLFVKATGPDLRYKWLYNGDPILDEFGRDAASSKSDSLDLRDINKWDKSGTYTCHVQNSCGDAVSEANLTFSVTAPFELVGSSAYCQGGDGVTLTLQGSLRKVAYGLYEKTRGYSDQTLSGDDVAHRGDSLYFTHVKAGTYYVEAIDTMNCRTVMPGEALVIEDPWPKKFKSSVDRPVCREGGDGDILLAGSEKYIEYFLCRRRDDDGKWDTLRRTYPGTGAPLLMTNIGQGTYKVIARNPISLCEVGMDEILDMTPRKLSTVGKLFAVDMDSIHCIGTPSDVKLMYDQFEPGYVYTLKRNGALTDKVRKFYPAVFDGVEAGIYCVQVTAPNGCSFDVGRVRVLGQQAPRVANLNGDGGVFCPEDAHPRYIEIDNTEAGVVYSLRRKWSEMNEVHIVDTVSHYGGAMTLEVPTKEGEYYVIATDTTPKHCSVKMNGTVTLKASRFDLNLPGSGGIVKVFDESEVTLTVSAHDAMGNVQYYWRPIDNLTTPNNQPTVKTVPITEPIILYVAATDDMGCSVEREVRVEPYGCAFKGAILNADGEVAENEQLCRGESIYLGSRWQCGGGVTAHYRHWHSYWDNCYNAYEHEYYRCLKYGTYWTTRYYPYITTYEWYDETGRINASIYSSSITYAKKESGWVYCKMTNGLEHQGSFHYTNYDYLTWDPQQVKTYKVWVEVQKSPNMMQVDSVGLREVVLNSKQVIQINKSEPVVKYFLEYRQPEGFEPVKDQEKWGTGGILPFEITGNHVQWGTYRVMAEYQNEGELGLTCRREMNGRVEIQERGFKERLEIERPMCEGDLTADLRITTSTKDAVYHICRQNGAKWDTLYPWYRGTGSAIIVKDVPKGTYKAVVTVDYTDNALKGIVEVKEQPLPAACDFTFVNNDSIYCWGTESELAIHPECYDLGYTYTLLKNGEDTKEQRKTAPVLWLGLMDGDYQVKITNEMGCSVLTPTHTIVQKDPPTKFQLIGEEKAFCDPREQGERILTMSSTEPGVKYSFRYRPEGEVYKDTVGDGNPLSITVPLVDRQYYVVATDTVTKCSQEMQHDVWVQLSPLAVSADKSIVTTKCGTPAQLRISITGATPPLNIEWNNEVYLADGERNKQNPYTVPLLDKSVRFKVTVTDSLGCVRTTEVLAECVPDDEPDPIPLPVPPDKPGEGGTLTATIFNGNCSSKLGDKITINKYDYVSLCASVSGGLGAYSYRWSSDDGPLTQSKAFRWAKHTSGYIYLEVATPDGQKATDKIWVEVVDRDSTIPVEKDPLPDGEGGPLRAQINDAGCGNAVSDTIYIAEEASIGFCAFASGGLGKYTFRWSDAGGLISESRAFRGWRPYESGYLYLEVMTAGDGQVAYDKVWIQIDNDELLPPEPPDIPENEDPYPEDPKPLRIDIMDGYCNVALDTVQVCQGNTLSLCANAVGGWGKYNIRWFDDVKTLGISRGLRYKKGESGYIFLEIMTGGDGQIAYDTVWVEVGRTPLRNRIADSGLRCILPEDQVDITLDGSEDDAVYQLEYSASNIGFDPVEQMAGTGEPITFHLNNAALGFYRITAHFPGEQNCQSTMFDYVEVRRAPRAFTVSGGWEYCEGAPIEGSIYIDTTELQAEYRLFRGNTKVETKEGIGGPMDFTGYYTAGVYYVDARIGECYTDMQGQVSVKITPKPLLGNVKPAGVLCSTSGPWEISVPESVDGYTYSLKREVYGAEDGRWTPTGTPPSSLSFGEHSEVGDYYVVAVNTTNGCEFTYEGPKIKYSEPTPVDWRVAKCLTEHIKIDTTVNEYVRYDTIVRDTVINGVAQKYTQAFQTLIHDTLIRKVVVRDTGSIKLIDVDTSLNYWLAYNKQAERLLEITPGNVVLDNLPEGEYCITAEDPETTCRTPELCDYITRMVTGYVNDTIPSCGTNTITIQVHDPDPKAVYQIFADWDTDFEWPLGECYHPNAVFKLEDLDNGAYFFVKQRVPQPGVQGDLCRDVQVFDVVTKEPAFKVTTYPGDGSMYRMCPEDSCEIRLKDMEEGLVYSLVYTNGGNTSVIKQIGYNIPRDVVAWDTLWHKFYRSVKIGRHWYQVLDSTMYFEPREYRDSLSFGDYFTAEGWYEIYAEDICHTRISRFGILHTEPPKKRQVYGDDKCIKGMSDSVRVFLSQRDEDISYYLYLNDRIVDSILYSAAPDVNAFNYQHEEGCYYVWAETSSPSCRTKLDRTVCMSTPPQIFAVEDADKHKVICRDTDSIPIYMVNTQEGVRYRLEKEYVEIGDAVSGTGDRMLVGYAHEAGYYTVIAWVGNCKERMSGAVTVNPGVAPELNIADTLRYCENSGGIQIEVGAPTADTLLYSLFDDRGTLLDSRYGDADGRAMQFAGSYELSAAVITVENQGTGCVDTLRVTIIEDMLPNPFSLKNENNGYLCPDASTAMYLEGSEPDVEYRLHKLESGLLLGAVQGTGERVELGAVDEMGTYYATAELVANRSCVIGMPDTIVLQAAPEIRDYKVNTVNKYYCFVNDSSGVIEIPGSQNGVAYRLYKEGVPTGRVFDGNGGRLEWKSLAGKSCDDIAVEDEAPDDMGWSDGYHYTVMATDKASGCQQMMSGTGVIVMEKDPHLWVCSPSVEKAVCEGEELHLNVSLATGCNLTYKLKKDGHEIYSGSEPVYDILSVQGSDFGVYQWSVANSCSEDDTKEAFEITTRDEIYLDKPMRDISFCATNGNPIVLTSGFVNALYTEWYKVGETEPLSTQQMLILKDKSEVGTYVCKAWNECNKDNPMTDTVKVGYGLPKIDISVRKDTVCAGDRVIFSVESGDRLDWYLDGKELGLAGKRIILNNVLPSQEGTYSVKAENNCGDTLFKVAELYVDDTVKIVDVSPDEVMCLGNSTQLFIKTEPMDRVKFAWYHNTDLISEKSTCAVGPFLERTQLSYTVRYFNACSAKQKVKSHTVHISVPKPIVYDNPANVIQFCADCSTDTVLRLNTDPGMLARYEWYCRPNNQDFERQLQDSEADTLAIRMCTRNSGFYYCRIYNKCETKTIQTCWIKVDSVPEVTSTWPKIDTICKGAPYTISISSTGGNMVYRLHILYPTGKHTVREYPYSSYDSKCVYTFANVTDALNDCKIWWDLMNSCDTITTDTMKLAVKPLPTLDISPLDTLVCGGTGVDVCLTLNGGSAPWEYGYKLNGDTKLIKVTDILANVDTLHIDSTSLLEFTYMQDNNGCSIPEFNVKANIEVMEGSTIHLEVESDKVCRRDTVRLKVKIAGGQGPWKFTLNEFVSGLASMNQYDFQVVNRDTVINFVYIQLDDYKYMIEENSFIDTYGGLDCAEKIAPNDKAKVSILGGGVVNWEIAKDKDKYIGDCEIIDLYKKYKPDVLDGKFYITDAAGHQKEVAGGIMNEGPGCYQVEYVYISDNGCPANISPISQELCVDSLPQATLHAPIHDLCVGGTSTVMNFDFKGALPFTYNYTVYRYDHDHKPMGTPTYVLDQTYAKADRHISMQIEPMEGLGQYVYQMTYLKDAHGCAWDTVAISDTVNFRRKTQYELSVFDGDWIAGTGPIYFERGDSLLIACRLIVDSTALPWTVSWKEYFTNEFFNHTSTTIRDTFKWATPGFYEIQANDRYNCGNMRNETLDLYMLDSGYMKCKLLLEGPVNSAGDEMESGIAAYLPTYGKPLPTVSQPIIDWVFVELRKNLNKKPVSIDSCLLLADGTLVDRNGRDVIAFPSAVAEGSSLQYHVVFRQRNHLPVATKLLQLGKKIDRPLVIDLTTGNDVYVNPGFAGNSLGLHMVQVGRTVKRWALAVGEVNENQTVTIYDPNQVAQEAMKAGALNYEVLLYDLNFNGIIEWSIEGSVDARLDWSKAKANRDRFTEVPPVE